MTKVQRRRRGPLHILGLGKSIRGDLCTFVLSQPEMFGDGAFERIVKFAFRVKSIGKSLERLVDLRLVLVELRFDLALKFQRILPHLGLDTLEIILEFSSKAKFEFFAIH